MSSTPRYAPESGRVHSHDVADLREDIQLALEFALPEDVTDRDLQIQWLVKRLDSFEYSQQIFIDILDEHGPRAFGQATLYSLENYTSLRGQAETLTFMRSLISLGVPFEEMGWPEDMVKPDFLDAYKARLAKLAAHRAAHRAD